MRMSLVTDCLGFMSFEEMADRVVSLGYETLEFACGNWSKAPHVDLDFLTEGLESVQAGGLIAEVAQNPYMMVYLGVETAAKKLNGEEIEKRIDSGAEVITKDNVDESLAAIKEYTSK
jgi:hypothetical protein